MRSKKEKILIFFLILLFLGGSIFKTGVFESFSTIEYIVEDTKEISDAGNIVWSEDSGVWHYWNVKGNAFGMTSGRELNFSYVMDWADDYFITWLNASPDNSTWYNASEGLTTFVNWSMDNDTGNLSAKMSWIINTTTAPTDLYYRLIWAIDRRCKNFINGSVNGTEVQFDIPFENETVSFFLNWSDLIPLIQDDKIFVRRGTKTVNNQTFLWFKAQTVDKLPNTIKNFTIDPTFGNTGQTGKGNVEGYRSASWGEVTGGDGTAENITVWCYIDDADFNASCALYEYIDYSSDYAGELIDYTEEKLLLDNAPDGKWVTFWFTNDSEPSIPNATKYYITIWIESKTPGVAMCGYTDESGYTIYEADPYDYPNWENPWDGQSTYIKRWSAYCSYTVSPSNNAPVQSGQKIYNATTSTEWNLNATGVSLTPTCINITINDADGDLMNWTMRTNESGTWKTINQSTSGVGNGTYSGFNTSWIDTEDTIYYISFNISDDEDWTNETFHFTTVVGRQWTQAFISWHTWGNISDQELEFESWHTWGNISDQELEFEFYHTWGNISDNELEFISWHTWGNVTGRAWQNVFTSWHTWGNTSKSSIEFESWHTWGNISDNELEFSCWHSWGNVSDQELEFESYHTWGNISNPELEFTSWHTWGNVSKVFQLAFTSWHTWGNISNQEIEFTSWHTWGNISGNIPPELLWHYPVNNSVDIEVVVSFGFNITDFNGDNMTITLLSNKSGSWIVVDTIENKTDGSHYVVEPEFNEYNTTYYYQVNLSDEGGEFTLSNITNFATIAYSDVTRTFYVLTPMTAGLLAVAVIFILLFVGVIWYVKKKNEEFI